MSHNLNMAFIDNVTINASAGNGGNGVVRWLREKGRPMGGPCGGDGGNGGDVLLQGVRDLEALKNYAYEKRFNAEQGAPGSGRNRHGANGEQKILSVPVGTCAKVSETGKEIEIMKEGETVVLFKGGRGGRGNNYFKSSTNQNPMECTHGTAGQKGTVTLELKIIADGGLIGLPNAGKSSLLNTLTHAHAKIGAYPFTTLEPNLGAFWGYVIADIPGIIEGAAGGKGLGSRFLKHVERTNMLIHLVSLEQEDVVETYHTIRNELSSFGKELVGKKEIVVLSKSDIVSDEVLEKKKKELMKALDIKNVYSVSIKNPESIKEFSDMVTLLFKENDK